MSKLRQILKLHCEGRSKQSIARMYNTSRNTVRKHIVHFDALKLSCEDLKTLKDKELDELFRGDMPIFPITKLQTLYSHFPIVEKELKRRGVTLLQQWEEYVSKYPDGYHQTQFYHYYKLWKGRYHPSMRIEHKAGEKMFVDFAGEKLFIIDPISGEVKPVEVFVAILGASQLTYVEAVESQKKEDFILACENALHYFGGSPRVIVPDNLKSAVTQTNKYEPKLNENFELFAQHYGMAVIPARVYKPKDKSLVEGAVKISYTRIYTHVQQGEFFSLEALNQAILTHLENHNNQKMKDRSYSRREQFEEMEKNLLQQLPALKFEIREQAQVTVMKNGHVCLHCDKHYYSVPYQYIKKKVKLLYSKSTVEIYHRYELIATHKRIKSRNRYETNPDHLASQHKYMADWNPEFFIKQGLSIHPDVGQYIDLVIKSKEHPEQAFRLCQGILSFAKRVGNDRLIKACNHAHACGFYGYHIIEKLIKNEPNEEIKADENISTMPAHENIRGAEYYQNQ